MMRNDIFNHCLLILSLLASTSCFSNIQTPLINRLKPSSINNLLQSSGTSNVDLSQWDFIDDIFLITTKQDNNQRLDRTQAEIASATEELWNKIKIRKFDVDKEDKVRGCYTSHIKVIEEINKLYGNRKNYQVLILEDNLEVTNGMSPQVLESINNFITTRQDWDIFHLAYMMYVPGLALKRGVANNIVQMIADSSASVGTSAYIISKTGVKSLLDYNKKNGFKEAIPNIMAILFPSTRYASFPMIFHRAGKVGSIVNPQLDNFRRVMFNPNVYSNWEKLMVYSGLQNNQLFPGLVISLFIGIMITLLNLYLNPNNSSSSSSVDMIDDILSSSAQLLLFIPLFVALWGASLFKPGNTGAGFAQSPAATNNKNNNL
eukprot:gene14984-20157_t